MINQMIAEITEYKAFFREWTLQQFHNRYRGSVLGAFWTLLFPLLIVLTFTLVFSQLQKADMATYGVYFFAGYVPWSFFIAACSAACGSILGNASYVSRIYVPKSIFPLASVLIHLPDLLVMTAILLGLMVVTGAPISPAMLFIPVAMVIVIAFVTGMAFLFAAATVFLRDFYFLWASVSFLWFFFTPILFRPEQLTGAARRMIEMNPFYPFVRLFQEPIAYGVLPSVENVTLAILYSAIALIAGSSVFARSQRSFYLYL